ncbi:hypothetical protein SAMD00079811_63710 [Scytonema sp. HK-05]|nr:hypothetical protein SAMD00079811_63710 [Scytonema sp. HK-05]
MTRSDDFNTNLIISGFLFMSFMYLLLLIYDLDNPFEYNGISSADIDLSSLEQSYHRLNAGLLKDSEPQIPV